MLSVSELGAKPIVGYPGYYVTQDGKVYSTRQSRTGAPKLIKVHAKGFVTLFRGHYDRKQVLVRDLVKKVWGLEHDGTDSH